jgi:hypothetical protein
MLETSCKGRNINYKGMITVVSYAQVNVRRQLSIYSSPATSAGPAGGTWVSTDDLILTFHSMM